MHRVNSNGAVLHQHRLLWAAPSKFLQSMCVQGSHLALQVEVEAVGEPNTDLIYELSRPMSPLPTVAGSQFSHPSNDQYFHLQPHSTGDQCGSSFINNPLAGSRANAAGNAHQSESPMFPGAGASGDVQGSTMHSTLAPAHTRSSAMQRSASNRLGDTESGLTNSGTTRQSGMSASDIVVSASVLSLIHI